MRENRVAAIGLGVVAVLIVIKLTLIVGVIYVAWHFISKWW